MLLLLTIVLVLVAAITLLIGIIGDTLPLIFLSIACSFGAGVTLLLLSSASKKRARTAAEPAAQPSASAMAPAPTPATPAAPAAPPTAAMVAEPLAAAAGTAPEQGPSLADRDDFPIPGYDGLGVREILPKLAGLDLDQLDMVLEHEENGKNRATLVKALNARMDELEALEEAGVEPATEVLPAAAGAEAAPVVAATDGAFPIPNYDDLKVAEILPLLRNLDDEQLERVYEREESGAGRATILNRIDDILDEREGVTAAPADAAAPEPAPAPKRAAPTKKAATKATPTRTAATKKAATKAAPAPRAATKKAATKAAAPAQKATTKKAAAKKATPTKAAAPAKKAATKKAATKAAAPATKATTKKAAAKRTTKRA